MQRIQQTVSVKALYQGSSQSAALSVNAPPADPFAVSSLAVVPASILGGIMSSTGTVTLNQTAPSGGATVTLASSNTSAATVPTSVTVAPGETSATFTISSSTVGTTTPVSLSATFGSTQSATLTVSSCADWSPEAVIGANEQVWIEDSVPAGANVYGTWTWDTTKKVSGTQSSTIGPGTGLQQYYFDQSPSTMVIDADTEAIVVYALLDPCNPPQQILFQFNDGNWEHRAYWGDNLFPYGTDGTNSRRRMGDLPPLGQWVRLVIPISRVGLGGATVSGMAFDVEGGRAWFDRVARVSCSSGVPAPSSFPPGEDVWVEDDVPTGGTTAGTWIWDTTLKASGTRSHTDPVSDGQHSHYFYTASQTISVGVGDTLFAYVLLSACDLPDTVVLQWNDGNWEHRGYWGANLFPYGTNGTDSLRRIGDLPSGGQWVRLEIPASSVGLEGHTISGLSFDLMGGKGWFDRAGVLRANSGALDQASPATLAATVAFSRPARIWAWVKRKMHGEPPTPPVSLAVTSPLVVRRLDTATNRRYSLYTPELNLMAETAMTTATDPPLAYEYVWFGGAPLAQIEAATNTIHWYFNDHLGTPILTTNAAGTVDWRVEREPYGTQYVLLGGDRHQPLGFPGQESSDELAEQDYNIFRWYRARSGRYTQADPIGVAGGLNVFQYVADDPPRYHDRLGLVCGVTVWTQSEEVDVSEGWENGYKRSWGHRWVEWPGGSAGFWPGITPTTPVSSVPGSVHSPDKKAQKHTSDETSEDTYFAQPQHGMCANCGQVLHCLSNFAKTYSADYCLMTNNCRSFVDQALEACGLTTESPSTYWSTHK